ncbi:potassium channel family protein [Nocardioides coralli]|uniref:potassium channel family protein n=1 Tax=Nocardioides coralli TaxID=2872154 RepID=UPI002017D86C|nr:TrkA family potassium uptake protein [Nocardioides coralli]
MLGLGRFGRSLALELMGEGVEVLGVDADARAVQSLAGRLTHVVEADVTDEDAMRELGVADFDTVVVGVGTDLESSILATSVAVGLGVRTVWAKAISSAHARILAQIGADHVVRPEHDMGRRVAHLLRGGMTEYVELDHGYAFARTPAPTPLVGRTLAGYGVRDQFGVTVVGIKRRDGDFSYATADTVVKEGDELIVAGTKEQVEAFGRLSASVVPRRR